MSSARPPPGMAAQGEGDEPMELGPHEQPILLRKPFAIAFAAAPRAIVRNDLESIAKMLQSACPKAFQDSVLTLERGMLVVQATRAPNELLNFAANFAFGSIAITRDAAGHPVLSVCPGRTTYVKPGKVVLVLNVTGLPPTAAAIRNLEARLLDPSHNDQLPGQPQASDQPQAINQLHRSKQGQLNKILAFKKWTHANTNIFTGEVDYVLEWNWHVNPPKSFCLPVFSERPEYSVTVPVTIKSLFKAEGMPQRAMASQTNEEERPAKRGRKADQPSE